jgi:hypothetical protein
LLRAAVEPKGMYIAISNPIPEGEMPVPVVVGRIGECTVWGSSESRSILDAPLPSGYVRQPDGTVVATGKSREPNC